MLFQGILCSFCTALFQNFGYIASRKAVRRMHDPNILWVHSQILMGITGFLLIPAILIFGMPPLRDFLVPLFWVIAGSAAGQFFFMRAEKTIEASRLSSLMGMRVIFLAVVTTFLFGTHYNYLQWSGILLAALSALVINHEHGEFRAEGLGSIQLSLICYCFSDLNAAKMVLGFGFESIVISSLFAMFSVNLISGFFFLPFAGWKKVDFRESLPYSAVWTVKQFFLYMSYALIGAVHANVVLSIRGPLGIGLGIMLVRLHIDPGEKKADFQTRIRRLSASFIMMAAIILYTVG